MAYELQEGFGNTFKNSFKEKESQPDFTGTILDEGVIKRVALWKKQTQSGDTFLTVALSIKEEKKKPTDYVVTPTEDIPF